MLPDLADMTDEPLSFPVIRPSALIDATVGSELFQVTPVAADVVPEAVVTLAVACTEVPDGMEVEALIDSVGDVSGRLSGVVDPDPPHATAMMTTKLGSNGERECIWQSLRWEKPDRMQTGDAPLRLRVTSPAFSCAGVDVNALRSTR